MGVGSSPQSVIVHLLIICRDSNINAYRPVFINIDKIGLLWLVQRELVKSNSILEKKIVMKIYKKIEEEDFLVKNHKISD
jgi:hypothetical protein